MMRPRVLALDLEGTLVSNAMSQFPRPGLYAFLDACDASFERVVLFTAVREERARSVLTALVRDGFAPGWVATMEIVQWQGDQKDLGFVQGAAVHEVWLVDDLEDYVVDAQRDQWWAIAPFDPPYPDDDDALARLLGMWEVTP